MSKFEYSTKIGDYGEPVRLSVSLELGSPLDKEEYDELKNALATIEKIVYEQRELDKLLNPEVQPNE